KVTSTSWSVDEAMNFIISGGTVAPGRMNFDHGVAADIEVPEAETPEDPSSEPAGEMTDAVDDVF
ncbi:MAG: DUF502 domain-containing protein, partial [Armatimonadota bacterium]